MCSNSQKILIDNKILYPEYFEFPERGYHQHSSVAWMSQKRDLKSLSVFLQAIYEQTSKKHCKISLISGEDFENFLVDIHLANEFEAIANSAGYSDIEWVVVQRNQIDYLLSIYSEKSAYKMVLDLGVIANSILKYGFFSASSPEYNYKFVFDIYEFSKFFKKNVNPNLTIINFDQFIDDFVGKRIFSNLVNNYYLDRLRENSKSIEIKRKRLSKEKIEFRYVANFLGMIPNREFLEQNKKLVDSLVAHRLNRNSLLLKEIKVKFKDRFQ